MYLETTINIFSCKYVWIRMYIFVTPFLFMCIHIDATSNNQHTHTHLPIYCVEIREPVAFHLFWGESIVPKDSFGTYLWWAYHPDDTGLCWSRWGRTIYALCHTWEGFGFGSASLGWKSQQMHGIDSTSRSNCSDLGRLPRTICVYLWR